MRSSTATETRDKVSHARRDENVNNNKQNLMKMCFGGAHQTSSSINCLSAAFLSPKPTKTTTTALGLRPAVSNEAHSTATGSSISSSHFAASNLYSPLQRRQQPTVASGTPSLQQLWTPSTVPSQSAVSRPPSSDRLLESRRKQQQQVMRRPHEYSNIVADRRTVYDDVSYELVSSTTTMMRRRSSRRDVEEQGRCVVRCRSVVRRTRIAAAAAAQVGCQLDVSTRVTGCDMGDADYYNHHYPQQQQQQQYRSDRTVDPSTSVTAHTDSGYSTRLGDQTEPSYQRSETSARTRSRLHRTTEMSCSSECPSELPSTRQQMLTTDIQSKGNVCLSVWAQDSRTVAVEVIEARNLVLPITAQNVKTFIQVELKPSSVDTFSNCQLQRTHAVLAATNLVYSEKIIVEIGAGDISKRLVVSCWAKTDSELTMVGCMSFGVKRLTRATTQQTPIEGSFYLLNSSIGQLKHIRVQSTTSASDKENAVCQSRTNDRECDTSPSLALVPSSINNNGNTACGRKRALVTSQRQQQKLLASKIRRLQTSDTNDSAISFHTPAQQPLQCSKYNNSSNNSSRLPLTKVHDEQLQDRVSTPSGMQQIIRNIFGQRQCKTAVVGRQTTAASCAAGTSLSHLQTGQYYRWNPDISVITANNLPSIANSPQQQHQSLQSNIYTEINDLSMAPSDVSDYSVQSGDVINSVNGCSVAPSDVTDETDGTDVSWQQNGFLASDESIDRLSARMTESDTTFNIKSPVSWQPVHQLHDTSVQSEHEEDATRQQAATQQLFELEKHFTAQMSEGILRYSRPLRCSSLSQAEHTKLFQNIEKLVRLSDYHVNLLTNSGSGDNSPLSVGCVYQPRVRMLCDAYSRYMDGLAAARQLLKTFKNRPQLSQYIQTKGQPTSDTSLDEFLELPVIHIFQLCQAFLGVLQSTPSNDNDYYFVEDTTHELLQLCRDYSTDDRRH